MEFSAEEVAAPNEADVPNGTPVPEVNQVPSDCNAVNGYDWDVKIAFAICMAESGGNPLAYNPSNFDGSNDAGLMQINSIHVQSGLIGDQERYNAASNVEAGYKIYLGSGFSAWSAFNNGKYLNYL